MAVLFPKLDHVVGIGLVLRLTRLLFVAREVMRNLVLRR